MQGKELTIGGRKLYLYCNAAACFDIYDIFGYDKNFVELMTEEGKTGYLNTICIASILAEQGELCRRWEGYDPSPIPSSDDLTALIGPKDFVQLRQAAAEAILLAFSPSVEDKTKPRYSDKGLAELEAQEKKTP